ncbi:putative Flp pilus assembly protein, ATPase CpaF [Vibrio nigripulchritudo SFn27]|uniref:Putative Flp pilus assembly protein, ATPase CpaF n=1 Tax=Vibrio nigripulchritudo TaxID=28173 RepID=U4KGL1_9VIBR|nr:putative Flp pilus assembly protein, ATPase CpaF [Vibrio nigripulchritudo BLFn1]CCN87986.1 putative Flp pilus assembly protein, ATPase CpaF [Vibrio nigripulchritudo SFn27]CCN96841.1 putative Flp pilus assembly protein, ATPase CpaF [Vibrio nigripulchritudo ENn2]CCO43506.1 putative Flp pilus assembly protein, ATPase CpaF [Vibrio nigripulchritudo SFn135]CCO51589.1 putative Flp pilus assembly protein, ATPase CpaF [Vibrio nigripulchritudo Wn13]CCO60484.1 putative Flp pilus assembly protein, ATPa
MIDQSRSIYIAIREQIFEALEAEAVTTLTKSQLSKQLANAIDVLIERQNLSVATIVREEFVKSLVDELHGLGPLQTLMDDESISDIMINGHKDVFIERGGIVEKSPVTFIDETQLLNIAKRIASRVGRRVDDSSPTCDARLEDGSRVNIVIPPIAIDGTSISIRKFKKQSIGLEQLAGFGAMSAEMAKLLMIASRCRLNILISGGTGSGKTTMLNALSQFISEKERIVTIEDAAELKMMQPHVVRLETRKAGIEGTGEIDQRGLVINSLRMRPDRIIVGECRGGEAFEMLQAMNTGHDGSMSTLHANTPRDALARVEAMVMMATNNLPLEAIRRTIVSAVDLVIQISRLHDGSRKVMSISEVVGLEGSSVVLEEIFRFQAAGEHADDGKIKGNFITAGLMQRSVLVEKARFFGLESQLNEAFQLGQQS